jgi:hypothetical protein
MLLARASEPRWFARERLVRLSGSERRNKTPLRRILPESSDSACCAVILSGVEGPRLLGSTAASPPKSYLRRGLNSPALTIQRFNESLGESRIPVTRCSDRSVPTSHRTMRLRCQRTDQFSSQQLVTLTRHASFSVGGSPAKADQLSTIIRLRQETLIE